MKIKFILIFFTISIISCKENKNEIVDETSEIVTKIVETVEIAPTFQNKTSELLYKLEKKRLSTIKKVLVGGEKANNIYEEFRKINDSILGLLNSEEDKLLSEDYIGFYSEVTNEVIIPAKYQAKINELEKAGLTIKSIGEGFHELQQKPDFYYEIFKNNVTDDYKLFLKNEAFDNQKLYSADAGLAISLKELSQRIINWENFLVKYPRSKLFEKSREIYRNYFTDYLFGMDNTPAFELSDMSLNQENRIEYERFMKTNPKLFSTKIIGFYFKNLNLLAKENHQKLFEAIDNEQAKYLKPAN